MSGQVIQGGLQEMEQVAAPCADSPARHDRGLLLIGLFKLSKCIFFFFVGIGAMKMLHKELGDEAMRMATALHFDPEGKFVSFLLQKVDLIDSHRLKEFSVLTFGYSALSLVEGTGLMLQKVWAEYLTLGLTTMFLPWELYELIRKPGAGPVFLITGNLIILGYLLWLLQRKKKAAEMLLGSRAGDVALSSTTR